MVHYLKIQRQFAIPILEGNKTFEIRINDRGYNKGDTVIFEAYDGGLPCPNHAINQKVYEITYVFSGYGLDRDFVVFGIREKKGEK